MSKPFKMICNSNKCTGHRPENYVVKFENKFVRNCLDCGSILYQEFRFSSRNEKPKKVRKKISYMEGV